MPALGQGWEDESRSSRHRTSVATAARLRCRETDLAARPGVAVRSGCRQDLTGFVIDVPWPAVTLHPPASFWKRVVLHAGFPAPSAWPVPSLIPSTYQDESAV